MESSTAAPSCWAVRYLELGAEVVPLRQQTLLVASSLLQLGRQRLLLLTQQVHLLRLRRLDLGQRTALGHGARPVRDGEKQNHPYQLVLQVVVFWSLSIVRYYNRQTRPTDAAALQGFVGSTVSKTLYVRFYRRSTSENRLALFCGEDAGIVLLWQSFGLSSAHGLHIRMLGL